MVTTSGRCCAKKPSGKSRPLRFEFTMNGAIMSWVLSYLCMYSWNVNASVAAAVGPHGFVQTARPPIVPVAFAPPW